jgi:LPS O-antigen subunit length determinant protein (WzzB/FepE family)
MSTSNEALLLSGPQSEVGKQEEFSMIALITLFWSRRRFFFWSMMAGLILSVVYAYVTPSRYESTVSLMPPDPFVFSGSDMLGLGAGAGNHIARLRNTSRSPGH